MDLHLLFTNLTNPALMFFGLGFLACMVKSDLNIPTPVSKFISLFLLLSIGFKGGQELAHGHFTSEIGYAILFGLGIAAIIPFYTFFILKRKLGVADAGAIASAYGSVSAVTFIAAASFLENSHQTYGGHMVAIMALMESPAIVVGVFLMMRYDREATSGCSFRQIVGHAVTNGSVLLILGSLVIGFLANPQQAEGLKPFTTDLFKGFLAVFLLDMGIVTAQRITSFSKYGWYLPVFSVLIPAFNGSLVALVSSVVTAEAGTRFMFAILAAGASYIAVPAAMQIAAPKANPGLYIPMALGVTFPFNITIGMVLYWAIIQIS